MTEILSPVPTRYLIDGSASQQWLNTPPLSPVSSRAQSLSPVSVRKLVKKQEGTESGLARRWIRWLYANNLKQWILPGSLLASTLIKFSVSLGSYSGMNTPPMYGDYEAQRHWMELTIHLPISRWYTYDLQYWGLDYPPLTAYVSWICGIIGHWIQPSWFLLEKSRGIETPGSKLYLRSSVLALDALIYIPSLVMFCRTWQGARSQRTQSFVLLLLLLQPALLLIDFGHFQYNSVMLGLTLLSVNFFATNQDLLGAFCFVLSLGFKQMALYYAPAIGTYLLAKCISLGPTDGFRHLVRLACVTILSLLVLFLPWLASTPLSILDPITRIFPFARGLFEDKVANFWCFTNVLLIKWKTVSWASPALLMRLSTALTALGFLPSVGILLQSGFKLSKTDSDTTTQKSPLLPLLPYTLLSTSLSFFLFSFQVHEKTILVPLLPITLLLSGATIDSDLFGWGVLANNAGVFSMWPLLKRDGLGVQYVALLLLWNRLIGYNPMKLPEKSFIQLISLSFYAAAVALHLLELVMPPPARYPDLFPVLNVLVSTPVFGLTWLWSIKCCMVVGWAVVGLGSTTVTPRTRKDSKALSDGNVLGLSNGIDRAKGRPPSFGLPRSRRPVSTSGLSVSSTRSRTSSIGNRRELDEHGQ